MKLGESKTDSAMVDAIDEIGRLITQLDYSSALIAIERCEEGLHVALSESDRGRLSLYAAESLYYTGRYEKVVNRADLAIESSRRTDAHELFSRAKCLRALAFLELGKLPRAISDFRESIFAYRRIENNEGELLTCNWAAKCSFMQGNYSLAKEYLIRSLELAEVLDDTYRQNMIRGNLGRIHTLLGDLSQAEAYLKLKPTSLKIMSPNHLCNRLISNAYLLLLMRDFARAAEHLEQARTIAAAHSFARETAIYHEYTGEMACWQGEHDEAEKHYRAAIKIGMEIAPEGDLISQSYRLLAELQIERGELDAAAESCDCAWRVAEKISERVEMGAIQRTRGAIAVRRGDVEAAKAAFADAIRILSAIGAKYELARTHLLAAEADTFETAYRLLHLAPAEVLFREIGVQWWIERVGKSLDRLTGGRSFAAHPPATVESDNGAGPFIGVSKPMRDLLARVDLVKNQNHTLLL